MDPGPNTDEIPEYIFFHENTSYAYQCYINSTSQSLRWNFFSKFNVPVDLRGEDFYLQKQDRPRWQDCSHELDVFIIIECISKPQTHPLLHVRLPTQFQRYPRP